jgi:hypothetical protein
MTTLYDQELDHLGDLVRDPDDVCHVFRDNSEIAYCGIPRRETHVHYGDVPWTLRYDYRCAACGGPLCKPRWDACMCANGWL